MAPQSSVPGKSLFGNILLTGLLAGFLDISAAILMYMIMSGGKAISVLLFVASGVFGKAAFTGGVPMAIWGLIFHFIIAFSFTALFFLAYPLIPFLKKKIVAGLGYGIFVWTIMNLVVLPFTNIPQGPLEIMGVIRGIIILMLAIGLPISWMAHRYYSE